MGLYDLSVTAADGSEVSMKDFEGKVVMVVNTATGCGFTTQYADMKTPLPCGADAPMEAVSFGGHKTLTYF